MNNAIAHPSKPSCYTFSPQYLLVLQLRFNQPERKKYSGWGELHVADMYNVVRPRMDASVLNNHIFSCHFSLNNTL